MAERSTRTTGAIGAETTSAEDVKAQAKETAKEGAGILRSGRDEAVREARHMVSDIVDEQRSRAASQLGGMANALHKSARDMESENHTMAKYTDMAADRIDEVARYLRQANWNDVMREAEGFARRQPYWFIGGAVAAGFLAARFLKSAPGAGKMTSSQRGVQTGERSYATSESVPSQPVTGSTTTPGYGQATTSTSTATGSTSQAARTGDLT